MNEEFLLIGIVRDLKRNLYVFIEAAKILTRAAYPYAKDDENLAKAIKRVNKIIGHKEL